MKLLFLMITLFAFDFASAQNPLVKQWDYRFGGTGWDLLNCVYQTTDGGFILGGMSTSGIGGEKSQPNWDPTRSTEDYWIVKIDSIGNKQWDKRYGGTDTDILTAIQQTSDKGYILGGYSQSGLSGDKSQPIKDTLSGNFVADYWVVKTDSLGNKEWDKDFGGTTMDMLYSIKQTVDGGFILGGYSQSDSSGDKTQHLRGTYGYDEDFWVIKIDSIGNKIWDKDLGGTLTDELFSISLVNDGGFILGGLSMSDIGGDKTQNNWGTGDYWIIKIDSLGNKIWDKDFGGTSGDNLHSITPTFDGGYILGGWTTSDSSGDKTQNSWGNGDYWIIKIDSFGNKEWDRDLGGIDKEDEFGNVIQTADSGYLISGTSYSNISGNKTENNLGTEQTWVIKLDFNGNIEWDKTLHTNGINHDEIGLAVQTSDGCFLMANQTNAGIGGDKTQAAWINSYDYWIIKFCDTTKTIHDGIHEMKSDHSFTIFPNPAQNIFTIEPNFEIKNARVEIYNLLGERVYLTTIIGFQETININFPSGVYLVKLFNEEKQFIDKLIVQ